MHAFRVPCPCRLALVYKMSPPLNLTSRDIACTEWNRQIKRQFNEATKTETGSNFILPLCNLYDEHVEHPESINKIDFV